MDFDRLHPWSEEDEMYQDKEVWPNRPAQSGNMKGADESAGTATRPGSTGISGPCLSQRAPNGA